MGERPILFSGPMVRALLDGRKTQTRRIVRVHDHRDALVRQGAFHGGHDDPRWWAFRPWDADAAEHLQGNGTGLSDYAVRAYADSGDTLWVRETFVSGTHTGDRPWVRYRATDAADVPEGTRWRPSIFMPRRACRLLLRVVSVRAERLQEITPEDIAAEGVDTRAAFYRANGVPVGAIEAHCERETFGELWDAINGERATWASDPWVWVVRFEVQR